MHSTLLRSGRESGVQALVTKTTGEQHSASARFLYRKKERKKSRVKKHGSGNAGWRRAPNAYRKARDHMQFVRHGAPGIGKIDLMVPAVASNILGKALRPQKALEKRNGAASSPLMWADMHCPNTESCTEGTKGYGGKSSAVFSRASVKAYSNTTCITKSGCRIIESRRHSGVLSAEIGRAFCKVPEALQRRNNIFQPSFGSRLPSLFIFKVKAKL